MLQNSTYVFNEGYQTLINATLCETMQQETLRRVIREELNSA